MRTIRLSDKEGFQNGASHLAYPRIVNFLLYALIHTYSQNAAFSICIENKNIKSQFKCIRHEM